MSLQLLNAPGWTLTQSCPATQGPQAPDRAHPLKLLQLLRNWMDNAHHQEELPPHQRAETRGLVMRAAGPSSLTKPNLCHQRHWLQRLTAGEGPHWKYSARSSPT